MTDTIAQQTDTHYLQMARQAASSAEAAGDVQRAIMYASLASAEAATRQAIAIEDMQEFLAEFVGGTNITSALVAWGEGQG
jgi:hypothetical protein